MSGTGLRVGITGIGVVSAIGENYGCFLKSVAQGRSGIAPLGEKFGDMRRVPVASVTGFDPLQHFSTKSARGMDRVSQFAVVAGREAVADAGLTFTPQWALNTAVIIGCATGGQNTVDDAYRRLFQERSGVPPLTIPNWMVNAPAAHLSIEFGLRGPSFSVSSACASANQALGLAFDTIRSGRTEIAIAGGAEASLTYGAIRSWDALRIMSPDTCRPFSLGRRGLVLGEGAAVFVLESLDFARARGATIHGELLGFGSSSDAASITAPTVDGAALALGRCLDDAKLAPEQVEYINAHGTGTLANDVVESAAIRAAFGRHADSLAISSTKPMHGHALGAAGALELAAVLAALSNEFLPPTLGFGEPDPRCDLDYVPLVARQRAVEIALSSSFAFGGHNSVLAVRARSQ